MGMMTNAQFSQQTSYLAAHCSSWAADALTLPEQQQMPLDTATLERFLESIRGRLRNIEKWAREPALADEPFDNGYPEDEVPAHVVESGSEEYADGRDFTEPYEP